MKKEKGMGLITVILSIILILALAIFLYCYIINKTKEDKVVDIQANLLLIKGKCQILEKTSKISNDTNNLKGKKITQMKEDSIISEFLSKGFIKEEDLEYYYVLSNQDLLEMELDIKNEKKSYYIVNYEDDIVFITKGYKKVDSDEILYELKE